MATSFDEIIDRALIVVNDYKLLKLINQSQEGFQTWCDGFVVAAIPNFLNCRQSLEYDLDARQFNADLTNMEISILSDLWVIAWYERETNDSTKLNALLQTNNSFKTHSASQNLKEKDARISSLYTKVSQKMMNDYELQHLDEIDI
jgi:hypothetical protein